MRFVLLLAIGAGLAAVGAAACSDSPAPGAEGATASLAGERVDPPFAVRDDARDLVLTFAGPDGPVTVTSVAEVPEAARERVRVDSLALAPEDRLDAERVYVTDLRAADPGGDYPVWLVPRAAFEAHVEGRGGAPGGAAVADSGQVVLYGASWCGACREARAYFRERGVPFVDRDIEREPGARQEMMAKARAAGVRASGIPVIDFRGTVISGFSRDAIDRLIARGGGG